MKSATTEDFDIKKAKDLVNNMINELDQIYPDGSAAWIEKEMSHFTPKTSSVDSAMAAAVASANMSELRKQIEIYKQMHLNAFAAFNSYRHAADIQLNNGLL